MVDSFDTLQGQSEAAERRKRESEKKKKKEKKADYRKTGSHLRASGSAHPAA